MKKIIINFILVSFGTSLSMTQYEERKIHLQKNNKNSDKWFFNKNNGSQWILFADIYFKIYCFFLHPFPYSYLPSKSWWKIIYPLRSHCDVSCCMSPQVIQTYYLWPWAQLLILPMPYLEFQDSSGLVGLLLNSEWIPGLHEAWIFKC